MSWRAKAAAALACQSPELVSAKSAKSPTTTAKVPNEELPKVPNPPFVTFGTKQNGHTEGKNAAGGEAGRAAIRRKLEALAEAQALPLEIVHQQTEADLAACAELTEPALAAYLRACHRSRQMAQDCLPAGYSKRVECAGCGAVWLPKGHPPHLLACPWCLHRLAGVRIPMPPVRCADCQHARPDSLNPRAGRMTCTAGECGTWPQRLHHCPSFQPRPRNPNDPTQ